MGAPKKINVMKEIFRDSASRKMQQHKAMIQTFLDRGYEIESQEVEEDKGSEGELITNRITTVLKPTADFSLPMIKLVAEEIFGSYHDDNEVFYAYDEAAFQLKAYKKGADIKSFKDPWQIFDLS